LASHVGAARIQYSAGTLAYATISDAVLGTLYLAFGIGAFRLKGWALTIGVAALVLDVLKEIAGIVIQGFKAGTIVLDGIVIVIALVLLWYLFRPDMRAAFGQAA